MIVIVDYGMGNLGSILNMLKKIGADAIISSNAKDIKGADKLILPGVGSFDNGMKNIIDLGLLAALNRKVIDAKAPVLGICLGMQLFTVKSQEGTLPGLGWISGQTVKFRLDSRKQLKIPHMGWNTVTAKKKNPILECLEGQLQFYFLHSYHVICNNEEDVLAKTYYGYDFVSAIAKENITGVQFHPEKSHKYGMRLLSNFVKSAIAC